MVNMLCVCVCVYVFVCVCVCAWMRVFWFFFFFFFFFLGGWGGGFNLKIGLHATCKLSLDLHKCQALFWGNKRKISFIAFPNRRYSSQHYQVINGWHFEKGHDISCESAPHKCVVIFTKKKQTKKKQYNKNKMPMAHYAYRSSSNDDDHTNKDGQWTTDYPINSPGAFQLWWAKYPLFCIFAIQRSKNPYLTL